MSRPGADNPQWYSIHISVFSAHAKVVCSRSRRLIVNTTCIAFVSDSFGNIVVGMGQHSEQSDCHIRLLVGGKHYINDRRTSAAGTVRVIKSNLERRTTTSRNKSEYHGSD